MIYSMYISNKTSLFFFLVFFIKKLTEGGNKKLKLCFCCLLCYLCLSCVQLTHEKYH